MSTHPVGSTHAVEPWPQREQEPRQQGEAARSSTDAPVDAAAAPTSPPILLLGLLAYLWSTLIDGVTCVVQLVVEGVGFLVCPVQRWCAQSRSRAAASSPAPSATSSLSGDSGADSAWDPACFPLEPHYPTRGKELVRGLVTATMECPVCLECVRRRARTWACGSCHAVFHLRCAREYVAHAARAAASYTPLLRCPCCRQGMPASTVREPYHCFCRQTAHPPLVPGRVPHTCGLPCGRPGRPAACTHDCPLACHPGPCPPCIPTTCHCGRLAYRYRCWEADPLHSCGGVVCRATTAIHAGGRHALERITYALRSGAVSAAMAAASGAASPRHVQVCGRRLSTLCSHRCPLRAGHQGPCRRCRIAQCFCGQQSLFYGCWERTPEFVCGGWSCSLYASVAVMTRALGDTDVAEAREVRAQ